MMDGIQGINSNLAALAGSRGQEHSGKQEAQAATSNITNQVGRTDSLASNLENRGQKISLSA